MNWLIRLFRLRVVNINKASMDRMTTEYKRNNAQLSSVGISGAVVSSILATVCCVFPFVMIVLGLGGAWLANLRIFEPFRPIFIISSFFFLGLSFYDLYIKPGRQCKLGSLCEIPETKRMAKILLWITVFFVSALIITPYLFYIFIT